MYTADRDIPAATLNSRPGITSVMTANTIVGKGITSEVLARQGITSVIPVTRCIE